MANLLKLLSEMMPIAKKKVLGAVIPGKGIDVSADGTITPTPGYLFLAKITQDLQVIRFEEGTGTHKFYKVMSSDKLPTSFVTVQKALIGNTVWQYDANWQELGDVVIPIGALFTFVDPVTGIEYLGSGGEESVLGASIPRADQDTIRQNDEQILSVQHAPNLSIARSMYVNLSSTAPAYFDGSMDVSLGVTGILPVSRGGTGSSSLSGAPKPQIAAGLGQWVSGATPAGGTWARVIFSSQLHTDVGVSITNHCSANIVAGGTAGSTYALNWRIA